MVNRDSIKSSSMQIGLRNWILHGAETLFPLPLTCIYFYRQIMISRCGGCKEMISYSKSFLPNSPDKQSIGRRSGFAAVTAAVCPPNEQIDPISDVGHVAVAEADVDHASMVAACRDNGMFTRRIGDGIGNVRAIEPLPVGGGDVVIHCRAIASDRPPIGIRPTERLTRRIAFVPASRGREKLPTVEAVTNAIVVHRLHIRAGTHRKRCPVRAEYNIVVGRRRWTEGSFVSFGEERGFREAIGNIFDPQRSADRKCTVATANLGDLMFTAANGSANKPRIRGATAEVVTIIIFRDHSARIPVTGT